MTTMADAFSFATSFNADISEWDVSSVTDMSKAFYACNTFDADISKWDVSAVENFEAAFYGNFAFNQDLSSWDTSAATTMNQVQTAVRTSLPLRFCKRFSACISGPHRATAPAADVPCLQVAEPGSQLVERREGRRHEFNVLQREKFQSDALLGYEHARRWEE